MPRVEISDRKKKSNAQVKHYSILSVQDSVLNIVIVNISLLKLNQKLRVPTVRQKTAPQLTHCRVILNKQFSVVLK